ncbi:uncharacterized protein LOC120090710 [Benincasa hispida]|uniref:uncharacterized protein LOC120090710 n=1 Tax=Benincasa hispida TaxID=102211 RepID=UPI00190105A6|nr:uncharacterized protein LOC120090710 [Benincasa hispida]
MAPYEALDNLKVARDRQKRHADKRRRELEFEVGERMLRKYVPDPMHILATQPVQLKEDLSYEKKAIEILDRKDQVLRNKTIPFVKVLWRNHGIEEATWEPEEHMRKRYP